MLTPRWKMALAILASVTGAVAVLWWIAKSGPPSKHEVWLYFQTRQDELDRVASQYAEHPEWQYVTALPGDGLQVTDESGARRTLDDASALKLARLMHEAGPSIAMQTARGVLVHLTSGERPGRQFEVALARIGGATTRPCARQWEEEEYGSCDVRLNDDWVINYEWIPRPLNHSE